MVYELHEAVSENDLIKVQSLLEDGADPYQKDQDGVDCFHLAICLGHVMIVKLFLDRGYDVNKFGNRVSPLHRAFERHQRDVASLLIDHGADLEALDYAGRTPIFSALNQLEDLYFANLLVKMGVNLNAKDFNGCTPLQEMIEVRKLKNAMYLIDLGADVFAMDNVGRSALTSAVECGFDEIALRLVKMGVSLHIKAPRENSLLHLAASRDHLSTVKWLIENGAELEALNEDGETPLFRAISSSCNLDLIRFLIEAGANPKVKGALHMAVSSHMYEIAQLLVEKGADVNMVYQRGKRPLHLAESAEMAELLINAGADINVQDHYDLETPLHRFASRGFFEPLALLKDADVMVRNSNGQTSLHLSMKSEEGLWIAELLVAWGADVNAKDHEGQTPLMVAVSYGMIESAGFLLSHGADVNSQCRKGLSILDKAVRRRPKSIVSKLMSAGAEIGEHTLYEAIQSGQFEIAKMLIERGAKVDSVNQYGDTPLHLAAKQEDAAHSLVTILIERGANVNAKSFEGETPLHQACSRKRFNTVSVLLESHADVNARCNYLRTPLMSSVGDLALCEQLIVAGADVHCRDKDGHTALHLAVSEDCFAVVKLLIENKADVNAFSEVDRTPLMVVKDPRIARLLIDNGADFKALSKQGESILAMTIHNWNAFSLTKFLIENGADPFVKDHEGNTLLFFAPSIEISTLLLDRGVDIHAVNNYGRSALMEAVRSGSLEMVEFLMERGANPLIKDNQGQTLLHFTNSLDKVSLLIDCGIDLNAISAEGDSILRNAVKCDYCVNVKLLIQKGADPLIIDQDGKSLLYYARSHSMAALLIKHGLDPQSAYKQAIADEKTEVSKILEALIQKTEGTSCKQM